MSLGRNARNLRAHPGEYENPADNATAEGLRQRFLLRISVVRPEVVQSLAGRPLELYRRIWRDWRDRNPNAPGVTLALLMGHLPGWSSFKHADPQWSPPDHIEIRNALNEWSRAWHLEDDWILDAAVGAIATWSSDSEIPASSDLRLPLWAHMAEVLPEDEVRFTFTHRGWQPTLEQWSEVRKEMKREFQLSLKAYEYRIRGAAEEEGWVSVKDSRFRKGDPMDWVITRVVDGKKTYEEIGAAHDVTMARTHKAVTDLAEQMGLTLPE